MIVSGDAGADIEKEKPTRMPTIASNNADMDKYKKFLNKTKKKLKKKKIVVVEAKKEKEKEEQEEFTVGGRKVSANLFYSIQELLERKKNEPRILAEILDAIKSGSISSMLEVNEKYSRFKRVTPEDRENAKNDLENYLELFKSKNPLQFKKEKEKLIDIIKRKFKNLGMDVNAKNEVEWNKPGGVEKHIDMSAMSASGKRAYEANKKSAGKAKLRDKKEKEKKIEKEESSKKKDFEKRVRSKVSLLKKAEKLSKNYNNTIKNSPKKNFERIEDSVNESISEFNHQKVQIEEKKYKVRTMILELLRFHPDRKGGNEELQKELNAIISDSGEIIPRIKKIALLYKKHILEPKKTNDEFHNFYKKEYTKKEESMKKQKEQSDKAMESEPMAKKAERVYNPANDKKEKTFKEKVINKLKGRK